VYDRGAQAIEARWARLSVGAHNGVALPPTGRISHRALPHRPQRTCNENAPMTLRQDIESFKTRIAQAEVKRDAWRAAGNREKYQEAFFAVEAMELLLDERLLAGRRDAGLAIDSNG
jgi:hypothetical protein